MNSKEIESNVKQIIDNFSKEEFIYDLLLAYGTSKTSIARLKKGDFNLSSYKGEILYKKRIFFKEESSNQLLSTAESASIMERVLKNNPRFVVVTDYETLVAKDIKIGKNLDIKLKDLPKYFDFFLPLAGSEVYNTSNDNKADREAAYKMAQLYDILKSINHDIFNSKKSFHKLNIFLSRLLFCYFAEDTGIFEEESIFTKTLVQHTSEDGSDMHVFFNELFHRLNTKENFEFPDYLARFPYVNGSLFSDSINSPKFNFKSRNTLIELGELNWKDINPDIFGSMIQAVILPEYRNDLGMHYTSVENILKLIRPLFLDSLYSEFEKCHNSLSQLKKLIDRISKIKFFDPACGSGNFLIITYKELRKLEITILKRTIELSNSSYLFVDSVISLNQFYGIEVDDFAHEMAVLSLWLAEHQMNQYFTEQLEGYAISKSIIPLKKSGTIIQGNSSRLDWREVCPILNFDEIYVIGNPPYLGSRNQDEEQKKDMRFVFLNDYKSMDYVAICFYKGARYIEGYNAQLAFVSTNSICQGEQIALTWPRIINSNIEISFAYQSFKWSNNAKGNAGVTVIILGLRNKSSRPKYLFSENIKREVKNINAYLLDAPDIYIEGGIKPISSFPIMTYGNMPLEGGFLRFTDRELTQILNHKGIEKFIRKVIGGDEFLNGISRYCFWIEDSELEEALLFDEIKERINKVKEFRINGGEVAITLLSKSHQFRYRHIPEEQQIVVPCTSSESRDYIPIGVFDNTYISLNSIQTVYDAQPWLFGVLHSKMHMIWVNAVGGKLESRYRYSAKLCYNTFPFPEIDLKQKENLNLYVFSILDERAKYPEKTMAQLYDPDTMPNGLLKAHKELDSAVEKCYRLKPFTSDTERLEYLFKLYKEMIHKGTLFTKQKKKRSLKINE
jgi:type II restriction/modification system DNA methylase subunit YeeA